MSFAEDQIAIPSPVEQFIIDGLSFPKLDRLRVPLLSAVLTEQRPDVAAYRIVLLADSLEPGALFDRYFPPSYTGARFRTKRKLLEVDKLVAPYYGLVNGAMAELRVAKTDPVVTDMWTRYFRQDNGIYRVQVVASMCVIGAFLDYGIEMVV